MPKQLILFVSFLLLTTYGLHATEKRFTILHTTDEHSHLLPSPLAEYHLDQPNTSLGGYARLATKVTEIRKEKSKMGEPVMLFSSGDILGGTPFAWLALKGEAAELAIMQQIGYDAMTIGNHEFDYGSDILAAYFENAGYKNKGQSMSIISSNIHIPKDHSLNAIDILEHKVYELENGLRVGVFGLIGDEAGRISVYAEPVVFLNPYAIARQQVAQLREKNADVIIAITHSGIEEDRLLAQKVNGIDLVLGGHHHLSTEKPEFLNQTYIFHSGYYLKTLGKLELAYNQDTKTLRIINAINDTPFLILLDDSVEEDLHIRALVNQYLLKLNSFVADFTDSLVYDINTSVVKSLFPLKRNAKISETTIGNFLTDAMRLVAGEILNERVDFAFQANGVIRSNILPAQSDFFKHQISFYDLATVSSLGTGSDLNPGFPLVSFYLTGKEIINILEISAMLSQVYDQALFFQISGIKSSYNLGKALHLEIPGLGFPLLTNRAVTNAQLYTGEGVQRRPDYRHLQRNCNQLYHVVADYYVLSFLPTINEMLPHLSVELKDKEGSQITPAEAIILFQGKELKIWHVLLKYAMKHQKEGFIPDYYANVQERIRLRKSIRYYVLKPLISIFR